MERRLLSSLNPFATPVEARTKEWRRLAESGKVSLDTLEYATAELEFTAKSFSALVDAAVTERWNKKELRLLRRIYGSVADPYHQAWEALVQAYLKASSKSLKDQNVVSLWQRRDVTMREMEKKVEEAA